MTRPGSLLLAALPTLIAVGAVESTEPFPHGWLDHSNPQFWPNVLRALAFVLGGFVLGMIGYVVLRGRNAERSVSGGHPRRRLYQHVTVISFSQGVLVTTVLFYIRDRINDPLSPGTPLAIVGLLGVTVGLALMLSYQNSRLRSFHAAKQVLGVIERRADDELCIRVTGSNEQTPLRDLLAEYEGGALARLSIEKVEEAPGRAYRHHAQRDKVR